VESAQTRGGSVKYWTYQIHQPVGLHAAESDQKRAEGAVSSRRVRITREHRHCQGAEGDLRIKQPY